jgi:hypothetical protein
MLESRQHSNRRDVTKPNNGIAHFLAEPLGSVLPDALCGEVVFVFDMNLLAFPYPLSNRPLVILRYDLY